MIHIKTEKKIKHHKLNTLIIFISTIFVLWLLLKNDYQNIINSILNANVFWLFITIIVFFLYFLFDQLCFYNILKTYKKDINFRYVLYLGIITKFFNGITPLSTGGQPLQVYEMHKKGISVSNGTNIVIQNYIVFQIIFMLYSCLAIILNNTLHLFVKSPLLTNLTIIGFIANFIILILLMLISFSKKFNKTIIVNIINFLAKLKIVKNKEKQTKKWTETCDEYYKNGQELRKNKATFIKCCFYQIISLFLYYLLPIFIAIAIGCANNLTIISTIVAGTYIYLMSCFIPIPGATGGTELGFHGFFANFVKEPSLSALLILWRFTTYYAPTIIGALIFNIGNNTKKELKSI